ncbi:MAG: histidine kinase [Bacteroidota bacterium]
MKTLSSFWLLLWLSLASLLGQNAQIDSLKNLWLVLPEDTMKVMTGLRYSQRLFTRNPPLGLAVVNEAGCLADSLQFTKGQFYTLMLYYDFYLNAGDWEYAWQQAQRIFDWSEQYERLLYKQEAYQKLGSAAANLYRPEAEEYFKQALVLGAAASKNDEQAIDTDIRTRYLYSQFLLDNGRSPEAMEVLQVAVKLAQEQGDLGKEITLTNIISTLWARLENFDKAIETQRSVLRLRRKQENPNGMAHSYQVLGGTYYGMLEFDSAIYYTEKALHIFEETQDLPGITSSHNNLGQMYDQQKNVEKTEYHLNSALKLYEKSQDYDGLVRTQINLGSFQVRQGKLRAGRKAIEEGTKQAELLGNKMLQRLAYIANYESLAKLGRYKEAYAYRVRYHQLKDSMINEENLVTIAELEKKYKTERQEREIADLKEEKASQDLEILLVQQSAARRTLLIYILIGALILGALLGWLFMQRNRLRLRQKSMELQQRLLRSRMNPHFIFNALNSIQRLYQDGDQLRANDYVADLGQLLRGILDHSGEEKISLEEEIAMLQRYLRMEQHRLEDGFQYDIVLDESLDTYDIMVPPLILQPLAENAIWHGILPKGGRGQIKVKIWADESILYFEVMDDGIGLVEARRNRQLDHDPKALTILEERLGGGRSLSLSERRDETGAVMGTEVRFSVPLVWREEN